jgi:hypothetical protein
MPPCFFAPHSVGAAWMMSEEINNAVRTAGITPEAREAARDQRPALASATRLFSTFTLPGSVATIAAKAAAEI